MSRRFPIGLMAALATKLLALAPNIPNCLLLQQRVTALSTMSEVHSGAILLAIRLRRVQLKLLSACYAIIQFGKQSSGRLLKALTRAWLMAVRLCSLQWLLSALK